MLLAWFRTCSSPQSDAYPQRQGITGTDEMLLAGAPSITLRLMARYTRVRRLGSHSRLTRVSLKISEVPSLNTVSSLGRSAGKVIGPIWRQAMENCEGSSATPSEPLMPPVRAWLMWQATPGTFGSSNADTHTR